MTIYDFTNIYFTIKMDVVFEDFRKSYGEGDGYGLSMTLCPIPPNDQPDRFPNFYRSTNFQHVQKDFKYRILHDASSPFKLPIEEGNGWVEVYFTYWKAIGEILNAEASNEKVRICLMTSKSVFWGGV